MFEPYAENVHGDFYVEKDCCLCCHVPVTLAPDLFRYSYDSEGCPSHCFVSQQPVSKDELERMFDVITCADLRCVRYGGSDFGIVDRLTELGQKAICDVVINSFNENDESPPPKT